MFIDYSKYDFNGSVKEVEAKTVSLFERENGEIVEHLESAEFCRFDKSKNLTEFSTKFPEKLFSKTINRYDSENRIIEIAHFNDNSLTNKCEYSYDSNGRFIERRFYDKNGVLISTYRPTYTKKGLRIEKAKYEPPVIDGRKVTNGQISFSIAPEIRTSFSINKVDSYKTVHTASEKLLEAVFYNKLKMVLGKIFVVYDDDGKPIEITVYGDDRSFPGANAKNWQKFLFPFARKLEKFLSSFYSAYKLSVGGNYRKAFRCFIYGTPFNETTFEYGENGKLKEIKNFSTDFPTGGKKVFKYDEKGNVEEEISYSENPERITRYQNYEYEYDSPGNWITKKTVYKLPVTGGKIMERTVVFLRAIEYY